MNENHLISNLLIGILVLVLIVVVFFAFVLKFQSPAPQQSGPTGQPTVQMTVASPIPTTQVPATAPPPTTTSIPGWTKLQGATVEFWVPKSYQGGDPKGDKQLATKLKVIGGTEFIQELQQLESLAAGLDLVAVDSHVGRSGYLTSINVISTHVDPNIPVADILDSFVKSYLPANPGLQLISRKATPIGQYDAERLITVRLEKTALFKAAQYIIKTGDTVYVISYSTEIDEFDQRLPNFEQSIQTFAIRAPNSATASVPTTAATSVATQPFNTPIRPTATSIPGWTKFKGSKVVLWLPKTFQGGDAIAATKVLKILGPKFDYQVQLLNKMQSAVLLMAMDPVIGKSGMMTIVGILSKDVAPDVTIESMLEDAVNQQPSQDPQAHVVEHKLISLDQYQAGRLIVEGTLKLPYAKDPSKPIRNTTVQYVVKSGNTMYVVTFDTGSVELSQRLPVFDQSMQTFQVQP